MKWGRLFKVLTFTGTEVKAKYSKWNRFLGNLGKGQVKQDLCLYSLAVWNLYDGSYLTFGNSFISLLMDIMSKLLLSACEYSIISLRFYFWNVLKQHK